MVLQDHCSYKAPTTNHHIKKSLGNRGIVCFVEALISVASLVVAK